MYFDTIRLVGLNTIDLPIRGLKGTDGYILKNVDGLGPVGLDLFMDASALPGATYQGSRPQSREMVFLIGLLPNYMGNQTPADMRVKFYSLLMPGSGDDIDVQFLANGVPVAHTIGYVNRVETVPFAKDPELQVTIACPSPWFQEFNSVVETPVGNAEIFTIENNGSAPSGLQLSFNLNEDVTDVVLTRVGSSKIFQLSSADDLRQGRRIFVNTIYGSRDVSYINLPASSKVSIIDAIANTANLEWFQVNPGVNQFQLKMYSNQSPRTNFTWNQVSYLPQHWGV